MSTFLVYLIIALAVAGDFFLLDRNRKRWGWMDKWSNKGKVLFFTVLLLSSFVMYFGMSIKYI